MLGSMILYRRVFRLYSGLYLGATQSAGGQLQPSPQVLAQLDPDALLTTLRQRLRVLQQRSANAGDLAERSAEELEAAVPPLEAGLRDAESRAATQGTFHAFQDVHGARPEDFEHVSSR